MKWYTKSAESGYSEAQIALGDIYFKGEMVEGDSMTAINWYIKAAQQGNPRARAIMGNLMKDQGK